MAMEPGNLPEEPSGKPSEELPQPPEPPQPPLDRSYGTPAGPHAAVRGEALLEVEPEIARITVTAQARGTDRRHTLKDLTRRNSELLALVKEYGDAVEALESGGFVLAPRLQEGRRGEKVHHYDGSVRLTATLADFTALGELAGRLADQELTVVAGPWWSLRPKSPAYREARQQALRDAVQRAHEYAEVVGSRVVALLAISDEGMDRSGGFRQSQRMSLQSRGFNPAAGEAAPPVLDLEPERQTVRAQVSARFLLAPPVFGEH